MYIGWENIQTEKLIFTDYYAFGSAQEGRSYSSSSYKYGFNGKENDAETGTQDYGMRIYNPGLGRFLSVDPLTKKYPWYSPYQFAGDRPIVCIDRDGLEDIHYSQYFKTRIGGMGILSMMTTSGLRAEIESSFSKEVQRSCVKADLYILFVPAEIFDPYKESKEGITRTYNNVDRIKKDDYWDYFKAQGLSTAVEASFNANKSIQLIVVNGGYLDVMSDQSYRGGNADFNQQAAEATLAIYHEYKLHVENHIKGINKSMQEEHKEGYGNDYLKKEEKYDASASCPSYAEIQDMASTMGVAKGKIEYVMDMAKKKQAAAQQQAPSQR